MENSNRVMRGLLATAPDALIALGTDGRILYANDRAERLFGWTREELVGKPVEVLVPERFANEHVGLRSHFAAHPGSRPMGGDLDLWAVRKDGSEFAAEISLNSFDGDDGPLIAAAVRDITDSRRTQQKLKAVLDSTPDAIIGVNADGMIELANDQTERLFGWRSEDLIGQPVEVLLPAGVRAQHREHRDRFLADPQVRPMGAGLSLSAVRKDGSEFPTEISLSPVADHEVRMVLAAIRDISERIEMENERRERSLEAQREQSHRLESLGQLAGGIAHDFNNLLGVILNYTTLISRGIQEPQLAADVDEIRAAANRGAALTRQLLTFARRDVVHPEPVDVGDVVRGVVTMLARTIGEHIRLDTEVRDRDLVVVADRHQLEQVLVNLAINARDAMPDGGNLSIVAERGTATDEVALRVSDTGSGMPADVVARAFEPFFTTKERGKGSGLGLATVYGIVRRIGGDVVLRSEVGSGTVVTVTLPGTEQTVDAPPPTSQLDGSGHERLLLVEDEEALRVGTARLLSAHGYEVVVAVDGLDALEVLEGSDDFALILTDVAMPRMRGDVFAARLAESPPHPPVIFMSGYESGGATVSGRVLPKPVAEEELLRSIREVLDA